MRKYFVALFGVLTFLTTAPSISLALECYLSDDYGDSVDVTIRSTGPISTSGEYNSKTGGHRGAWTDTGLYTNGDPFVVEITGGWTPWLGDYKIESDERKFDLSPQTILCNMETLNKDSKSLGVDGEFRYIRDNHIATIAEDGQVARVDLRPEEQKSCWLTGGEGLYVAFFGKMGHTPPAIAFHLKTERARCDREYWQGPNYWTMPHSEIPKDINVSLNSVEGAIPLDQCYAISCPSNNYFQDKNANGKLDVGECYRAGKNGKVYDKTIRSNRIVYVYATNGFINPRNDYSKDVDKYNYYYGPNERIKMIILDRYYYDNIGSYNITFKSGITLDEEGFFQKLVKELEDLFVGSVGDDGSRENGFVYEMYQNIVVNFVFGTVVRLSLVLYIMFTGLSFIMGLSEFSQKELMMHLIKFGVILLFVTPTGWNAFNNMVMHFFFQGIDSVNYMISTMVDGIFSTEEGAIQAYGRGMYTRGGSSKFAFVDTTVATLFSRQTTVKIAGLFFGRWYGFLAIPIMYIVIIMYVIALFKSAYPYIVSLAQITLALALSPIFFLFFLFKKTEHMFKAWLSFIATKFLEITFLFTMLYMMSSFIKERFKFLLDFDTCKVPLFEAIGRRAETVNNAETAARFFSTGGVKVWETFSNIEIGEFFINIFSVIVAILIFQYLVQKSSELAGSISDVWGQSGGDLGISETASFSKDTKGAKSHVLHRLPKSAQRAIANPITTAIEKIKGTVKGRRDEKKNSLEGQIKSLTESAMKQAQSMGMTGDKALAYVSSKVSKELKKRGFEDDDGNKLYDSKIVSEKIKQDAEKDLYSKPFKKAAERAAKQTRRELSESNERDPNKFEAVYRQKMEEWAEKSGFGAGYDSQLTQQKGYAEQMKKWNSARNAEKPEIGNLATYEHNQRISSSNRRSANELGLLTSEMTDDQKAMWAKKYGELGGKGSVDDTMKKMRNGPGNEESRREAQLLMKALRESNALGFMEKDRRRRREELLGLKKDSTKKEEEDGKGLNERLDAIIEKNKLDSLSDREKATKDKWDSLSDREKMEMLEKAREKYAHPREEPEKDSKKEDSKKEPEPGTKKDSDSKPKAEPGTDTKTKPKDEAETELKAEAKTEPKDEAETESRAEDSIKVGKVEFIPTEVEMVIAGFNMPEGGWEAAGDLTSLLPLLEKEGPATKADSASDSKARYEMHGRSLDRQRKFVEQELLLAKKQLEAAASSGDSSIAGLVAKKQAEFDRLAQEINANNAALKTLGP